MHNTKSKVLILDDSEEARNTIKVFCDTNNLMALTSRHEDPITVLKSFVDLGAIFISESLRRQGKQGFDLAAEIHYIRPELPIFFRCPADSVQSFKSIMLNRGICCAYQLSEIDQLKDELKANIFNQHYPNTLLRGIEEIANRCLTALFPNVEIEYSAPYLVKDRIIYGELFSLIPMESDWCKGYMMLQTTQERFIELADPEKIPGISDQEDFHTVNDFLSELTNLIWGGIKARFINMENKHNITPAQIPIIVNHTNQYITFGTNTPQLCFQYTLRNKNNRDQPLTIHHKFVFNINWAPEKFRELESELDSIIDTGELEFF